MAGKETNAGKQSSSQCKMQDLIQIYGKIISCKKLYFCQNKDSVADEKGEYCSENLMMQEKKAQENRYFVIRFIKSAKKEGGK